MYEVLSFPITPFLMAAATPQGQAVSHLSGALTHKSSPQYVTTPLFKALPRDPVLGSTLSFIKELSPTELISASNPKKSYLYRNAPFYSKPNALPVWMKWKRYHYQQANSSSKIEGKRMSKLISTAKVPSDSSSKVRRATCIAPLSWETEVQITVSGSSRKRQHTAACSQEQSHSRACPLLGWSPPAQYKTRRSLPGSAQGSEALCFFPGPRHSCKEKVKSSEALFPHSNTKVS